MVLKVVTGKIFKTWKLSQPRAVRGSVLELRRNWLASEVFAFTMIRRVSASPGSRALGQVVKDRDYLADNLYVFMLSELKALGQQESGWAAEAVPNWESGGGVFAEGAL